MTTIPLSAGVAVKIANAGNRDFLHISNSTGASIYVCYDGEAQAEALLNDTPTSGVEVQTGQVAQLNNDGSKPIFTHEVWAISVGGGSIQLQGV